MSEEFRDDETETPDGVEEPTPDETPDEEPETEGTEGVEPSPESTEPYLKFQLEDGTEVSYPTQEAARAALAEREYLKRKMPDLGRDNKTLREQLAEYEKQAAEWGRISPMLQNESVKRALLAAHYGVAPELLENSSDPAVAQALNSILPRLSELQQQVAQQASRISQDEMERALSGFLADNNDIADSDVLQQAVANKLDEIAPASELRTAAGARKWMGIAATLVRSEMSPAKVREQTDAAVRKALAEKQKEAEKNRKLASVVGKGAGKVSVGKINPEDYEPGLKGSMQLTHDAMARFHGQSAGRKD